MRNSSQTALQLSLRPRAKVVGRSVAADGRFLMNITPEETISPITLIFNWEAPGGPKMVAKLSAGLIIT